MHSHHSHSGTYVSHAADDLDSVVARARDMGFSHFCLTEHMPRLDGSYLYPEELAKKYDVGNLEDDFTRYLVHAGLVQKNYNKEGKMKVLVGLEIEGIDERHIDHAAKIIRTNEVINMSIGSVHFINGIPIDFSAELWLEAARVSPGKSARSLYQQYFEIQRQVLERIKPEVVGHFDLIRLFAPLEAIDPLTKKPLKNIRIEQDWPEVWEIIIGNIELVKSYGGLFELNSASLRKGWDSPYPRVDICEAIIKFGDARFCLSDDSHAIKQVGMNFHKVWTYIVDVLKLRKIYHLDLDEEGRTVVRSLSVETLAKDPFWDQYNNL